MRPDKRGASAWGRLRGDWVPGHFRPTVTLAANMTLLIAMMVRGVDYAAGDSGDTARRLATVEAAAPLWAWGGAFIAAASLGFLGMLLHRREMVFQAHLAGWALYWALGSGVIIDVLQGSDDPAAGLYASLAVALVGSILVALTILRGPVYYDWWVAAAWVGSVAIGLSSIGLDGIRSGATLSAIGAVHMLIAIGTAEVATRSNIEKARLCGQDASR